MLSIAWWRDGWRARPNSRPSRLFVVSAISGLLAVAAFAWTSDVRRSPEPYTAFLLLGPSGRFEKYPERVDPGQPLRFELEITNREGNEQRYRVSAGSVSSNRSKISL